MGRVRRSFLGDGRKYVVNSHCAALQCGPCCFSCVLFVWDLIEDGKSYIQANPFEQRCQVVKRRIRFWAGIRVSQFDSGEQNRYQPNILTSESISGYSLTAIV